MTRWQPMTRLPKHRGPLWVRGRKGKAYCAVFNGTDIFSTMPGWDWPTGWRINKP